MKLTIKDICLIGIMVAVIEVCKVVMASIPNIELTTFWLIIFTLYFGKRVYFAVPVFILLEGAVYGFGLWWVMYLYTWPLLVIVVRILRKPTSALTWSIIAGLFGLLFGFFCSIPYFFIGAAGATIANGIQTAFAWWVAGIPWDLVHGISNFVIMLVLYHPIMRVMNVTKKINF